MSSPPTIDPDKVDPVFAWNFLHASGWTPEVFGLPLDEVDRRNPRTRRWQRPGVGVWVPYERALKEAYRAELVRLSFFILHTTEDALKEVFGGVADAILADLVPMVRDAIVDSLQEAAERGDDGGGVAGPPAGEPS